MLLQLQFLELTYLKTRKKDHVINLIGTYRLSRLP